MSGHIRRNIEVMKHQFLKTAIKFSLAIRIESKYYDFRTKKELSNAAFLLLGLNNLPRISRASTRDSTPGVTDATT